jgi:hypothetical protein
VIQDANPAAEALERLALWMLQRFAPIVAPILQMGSSSTPPALIICTAERLRRSRSWSRSSLALKRAALPRKHGQ